MLDGYKTYLVAFLAFVIAACTVAIQYCNGEPMNVELLISALVALAMIFLRQGVKGAINENCDKGLVDSKKDSK